MEEKEIKQVATNVAITMLCKDLKEKIIRNKEVKENLELSALEDITNLFVDFVEVFIERLAEEDKTPEEEVKHSKEIFVNKLHDLIRIHTDIKKEDYELSRKNYSEFLLKAFVDRMQ